MSIDQSTAARVAKLARIKVEDDQLPALAAEFNTILGFIEQLSEVDVEGVEPMTSVTPQRLKRRVDEVTDGSQQDKVLVNAPDAREGFFAVPKVVE
ncbi:Asp-tRNA(Asn)/Glu-tRNA(Gln) amidotransferase subunit GatC [Tateyamaria sp. ANG-S1]|uniref:Asp-tRNA(Asn)/Glu-tRNA(Gln) amidotransferase subunit GatC n=1 Tax=Tateyamaria sp. ANG-S1 TaxID=1577905 RepID=UPI00057ED217|nr:Asp-tRNA(Asn)/Glu-tRNA(Gln) amidotransferase subunit GatC [Tateyamaria sp. ANG-S1]KIC50828.1 aspartyl/glutamyl-tRNA(Asn/Gln) amidotransferase subunit C [Tateyamaria sp. ANG-S1]